MATAATIDFEALLAPISDDAPCGVALKDDPASSQVYYAIKDAREAARVAERAAVQAAWADEGDMPPASTKADWPLVVRLASGALKDKSKDLWIAAWLLEGLTRQHGFAGLRDGFRLAREMCERYWDCIHPRPDDEGVATTVAQLAGLNGEGSDGALLAPIAAIPITQGTSFEPLTGQDRIDAENLSKITDPDVRSKRIAQGVPTLEMFDAAARETKPEFFAELRADITEAIAEFDALTRLLDEKCGNDSHGYSAAPPSSQIANALADSLARVRVLAGEEAVPPAGEEAAGVAPASGGKATLGGISSREDAFSALIKVSEFFRRTEPHSPVSYALEQAVRWGRMPLPDLIRDLVSDESVRREFFRRTGMPMDSDS